VSLNEGIQVEDNDFCLLCGAKGKLLYRNMRDRLFGAPGVWSFLRCPQDDFVWLNPRPVIEDNAKVYATYYTHDPASARKSCLASLKRKVEEILLKTEFGYDSSSGRTGYRLTEKVLKLFPMAKEFAGSSVMWLNAHPGGNLLDVGCGNGNFLMLMHRLGWNVSGIEPDKEAAIIARKRLGPSIVKGNLEGARFSDNLFDAVTAHHVIEHMHDPAGFFKESYRILKPGGKLIVTAPNILSLGQRIFGVSWLGFEAPRHLHIFSPQSIRVCAEKAGFVVQSLRTTARSAWEIWCSSRLIHRNGSIPGGFPRHLNALLRFEGLIFQLFEHALLRFRGNLGEGIILIALKPKE